MLKRLFAVLLVSVFLVSGPAGTGQCREMENDAPQQNTVSNTRLLYTPHAPISINSNADFTPANGVVSGSGTPSNPYIIEGWDIDGRGGGRVIYIGNTTVYFIVRNCYLHNGSYQSSPYLMGAGIQLYNVQNGLLENNNCSSNYEGIDLWDSSSNTLTYNTCSNNWYGIYLMDSSSNTLTYNTCSNNYDGIYLGGSSGNTLAYNTCSDNRYGIWLGFSSGNTLAYNAMVECGLFVDGTTLSVYLHTIDITNTVNGKPVYYYKNQTGITVPPDAGEVILVNCPNFIVENLVLNNGSVGIELAYSSYGTVRNNICSSNNYVGIRLYSSSSNTLTYNTCNSNNYNGIDLYSSSGNTLVYNTCSNNIHGIYMASSSYNMLSNNTCSNNYRGIYLDSSSSNMLTYNTCNLNYYNGIGLYSSSDNTLTNNTCSNNYWGIYLRDSSVNTLTYINITGNTRYGVYSENSNSNRIHHNNFINNNGGGVQAYDNTGTNYWDDGSEGNYWSDYTSRYPNANPVGNVWDTPYELDGGVGAKDYYPLVGQVQIPAFPSPLLIIVAVILLFFVTGRTSKKIAQRRAGLRLPKHRSD